MLHERFDIQRFQQMFPLSRLRAEAREFVLHRQKENPTEYAGAAEVERHVSLMEPSGEIVTGPYHMAVIEQLRAQVDDQPDLMTRVPTDVFIWAHGEPADRRLTKIGGLPWWPRDQNWPASPSGSPLRFVAQFCFADSRFTTGNLPGTILVMFDDPVAKGREKSR